MVKEPFFGERFTPKFRHLGKCCLGINRSAKCTSLTKIKLETTVEDEDKTKTDLSQASIPSLLFIANVMAANFSVAKD